MKSCSAPHRMYRGRPGEVGRAPEKSLPGLRGCRPSFLPGPRFPCSISMLALGFQAPAGPRQLEARAGRVIWKHLYTLLLPAQPGRKDKMPRPVWSFREFSPRNQEERSRMEKTNLALHLPSPLERPKGQLAVGNEYQRIH